jgi:hypothetical protein
MGDDPWCAFDPPSPAIPQKTAQPVAPQWTPEAQERLARVPIFLRAIVKSSLERYAREKGLELITPELMMAMRVLVGGQR